MESFIINGGKSLSGEIEVRGAKNAALPILAACLLTKEPCVIDNIPLIEDVFRLLDILKEMGAQIDWLDKRKIKITAKNIDVDKIESKLVSRIRSSILLLGPLLARFDKFKIAHPGGCIIGARPTGTHFRALEKLGARISQDGKFHFIEKKKLEPNEIVLNEFSVTATENLLMAASSIPGKTIIKIAASEPHVQDLCFFLKKMGAKIKGIGTHTLEIYGAKQLRGVKHFVIPDANEAGTFIIMAAAARGKILIKNLEINHLDLVLEKLREMGAGFELKKNGLLVKPVSLYKPAKIQALPYPGVPTDLQAPFAVLCTQADGVSLIHDPLFEGRLRYIDELNKMGANALICDPHRAVINGPTPLYGTKIASYDLRAGVSLIIAALIAKGESVISDIYQVDRGYEKIEERLQKLGAEIKRVESP